jgi:hypothetical protein
MSDTVAPCRGTAREVTAHDKDTPPGAFAARWPEWCSDRAKARRATIRKKLLIYSELQKPMIEALIAERLRGDPKAVELVCRFATSSPNLTRSVVDAVAVAYSRGCQRTLAEASRTEAELLAPRVASDESKAFAALIDEVGMDRLAPEINAISWLCGPVIVSPCISERGVAKLDVLTGDRCERKEVDGVLTAVLWRRPDGVWIELTDEAWTYIDEDHPKEIAKQVPHTLGYCPAVPFRSSYGLFDWWQTSEHTGLIDATLDVGYKLALGLWYRQVSGNKLTVIWGDIEGIAPGQTIGHPALPLYLGRKQDSEVQVYDRIISANDYLNEIGAVISMAVSRYGIPPSEVTFENNGMSWHSLAVTVRGEKLGKLRDRQVQWLRVSERDLWPMLCDMIRAAPHRLRGRLPAGADVRERLRIFFPDLATPADIIERIEALKAGLPYGLDDPTRLLLAAQPELPPAEVEEMRERNMAREVHRQVRLAVHNVPGDPANGLQSIAQLQGRLGGQMSGEVRRETEETDL